MSAKQAPIQTSRRSAVAAAILAFVAPLAAQPRARQPRIAWLGNGTDPGSLNSTLEPFRRGLRELGWIEGQNLAPMELRFAQGQFDRYPALLDELLRLQPDVLVTLGPRASMLAKEATQTLPIVALAVDDPVVTGLVTNIARPGGNVTGVSAAFDGLLQKRLQVFKEILPSARRFAILFNSDSIKADGLARAAGRWEGELGVALSTVPAPRPEDFDAAFATIARERADGVAVLADPVYWRHRALIGERLLKHRLPSIWGGAPYLDAGGLASYQGDWPAMFRRGAAIVDKVLKGTKPGDIAFEQGTKLELVVNLKAAKALGITIPQSVLLQADEVIE